MKKNLFIALFIALSLIPVALRAVQDNPPAPRLEINNINPTDLPTVVVVTNVFDSLGQPVAGLTIDNFVLSGELVGKATIVKVENTFDEQQAFAAVLVIDVSSSMDGKPIEQAKEAARTFISAIGPNDPVAIVTFGSTVQVVQDYTTSKTDLLNAITSVRSGGKTALYDGGKVGVDVAAKAPLSRRAVILLSDGAEYGGVSRSVREAALNEARIRGVPVYTVGLGYGIDRTYLRELSGGTNAQNYESPSPDQLIEIYRGIAKRLRSQYIITVEANLPLDGATYDLTLQANTPEGTTAPVTAILRAPIPVPIVKLPTLPAEPISAVTLVEVQVAADDPIASSVFTIDGNAVDAPNNAVTIDPMKLTPGSHTLDVEISDANGDTGKGTLAFTVAALPSQVTIVSDLANGEIKTPQKVTLDIVGQTATSSATYSLDGSVISISDTAPYEFTIDPFKLAPGEHTLTVVVLNLGGVSTTVDQKFTVAALPPLVTVRGLENGQSINETVSVSVDATGQTPISSIVFTVNKTDIDTATPNANPASANISIDPMTLKPGANSLSVTVTDASGQTTTKKVDFLVAALPPQVTVVGLKTGDVLEADRTATVTYTSQTDITKAAYTIDEGKAVSILPAFLIELKVLEIPAGEHSLTVTLTNAGGQSQSVTIPFSVSDSPGLTATAKVPTSTPTPVPPSNTPIPVTNTAQPSNTPIPASATLTASPVPPSSTSRPSDTPPPTNTPRPTDTPKPTNTPPPPTSTPVPPTPNATATTAALATAQSQANVQAKATADAQSTTNAQNIANSRATIAALATTNAQMTATFIGTVNAVGTARANASATVEAVADLTATQAAANVRATSAQASATQAAANAQATANAKATSAQATANAQAAATQARDNANVVATVNALSSATQAAANAQATLTAQATTAQPSATPTVPTATKAPTKPPTAEASATPAVKPSATKEPTKVVAATEVTAEVTPEATVGVVSQNTQAAKPTATSAAGPTSTAIQLTEVQAQGAPSTETSNNIVPIIVVIGIILVILLVWFFILRGRRR